MWADSPFAEARGSFPRPVPLPTHAPDEGTAKSVTISCDWLPWVRGALQQLLLQSTWATDDPAALLQVQEWAFALIDLFNDDGCAFPPYACPFDFTVGQGIFEIDPHYSLGMWTVGVGYTTTFNASCPCYEVVIDGSVDDLGEITSIDLVYDGGPGPDAGSGINFYLRDAGGGLHGFEHVAPLSAGVNHVVWTGLLTTYTYLVIELNAGADATNGKILSVTITGRTGVPPCS